MQLLIVIVLALALSVPIGSALTVFGALLLEFALGYIVEAGERFESDPAKRKVMLIIGSVVLVACVVCICLACALSVWFLEARR